MWLMCLLEVEAKSVSPGTETKVRMENFLEEVPQKQCVWVVFVTPYFFVNFSV